MTLLLHQHSLVTSCQKELVLIFPKHPQNKIIPIILEICPADVERFSYCFKNASTSVVTIHSWAQVYYKGRYVEQE